MPTQSRAEQGRKLVSKRPVASARPVPRRPSYETDLTIMREEEDVEFTAGVFLGISNNEDTGALAMGFSGDLSLYRFLGAEVFVFHDVFQGGARDMLFSQAPPSGDASQYGAFLHTKLRAPISWGAFRITPKVGAGLGTRGGLDVRFNGATALAGLEIRFLQIGTFDVDYMQGIAGRTRRLTTSGIGDEAAEQTSNADAETFNRLGIGLTLQATPDVGFGARYIRSQIQGVNRALTLLQGTYRF